MTVRHILIIGGGASGVILAAHLLREGAAGLRVTLVEPRGRLGQGIAYDTPHDAHLLNTRSGAMSAFADRPDHFLDWLTGHGLPSDPQGFVPRHLYADYLESLLVDDERLRWERQECVSLATRRGGIVAGLADGRMILADDAVLATGHLLAGAGTMPDDPFASLPGNTPHDPLAANHPASDPWHAPLPEDPQARVLILGTGLTMVDRVMRLLDADHRGEIVILSRRGLLPRVNAPSRPIALDRADLPLGAGAGYALGWLRAQVRWHEARGGDWRDIVDGARVHLALWWQSVPEGTRARFLRHARRFWEVHRHRIPQPVSRRLEAALASGQVRLLTGRVASVERDGAGFRVRLALRGGTEAVLKVAQISDGRGLLRDPERHAPPLLRDLLRSGLGRIDPLRIGLEVGADGRVIPRVGTSPAPLHAIGPAARVASWEALAIVDIRAQAAELTARLIAGPAAEARCCPGE
ncbi:FAD/NAD(P)-binding protein [Paenirhodobacter sp.]|uniref:FAD/NAD(P)-binding protein n=1 Tax=Paenirhodobacter sp. TaxID=1965326 RepID=UPI003B3C0405